MTVEPRHGWLVLRLHPLAEALQLLFEHGGIEGEAELAVQHRASRDRHREIEPKPPRRRARCNGRAGSLPARRPCGGRSGSGGSRHRRSPARPIETRSCPARGAGASQARAAPASRRTSRNARVASQGPGRFVVGPDHMNPGMIVPSTGSRRREAAALPPGPAACRSECRTSHRRRPGKQTAGWPAVASRHRHSIASGSSRGWARGVHSGPRHSTAMGKGALGRAEGRADPGRHPLGESADWVPLVANTDPGCSLRTSRRSSLVLAVQSCPSPRHISERLAGAAGAGRLKSNFSSGSAGRGRAGRRPRPPGRIATAGHPGEGLALDGIVVRRPGVDQVVHPRRQSALELGSGPGDGTPTGRRRRDSGRPARRPVPGRTARDRTRAAPSARNPSTMGRSAASSLGFGGLSANTSPGLRQGRPLP